MRRPSRARATALALAFSALSLRTAASADLFPPAAFSDGANGATGAAFLKIPASARAAAMGGSSAASTWGAESLFLNPAGLAAPSRPVPTELSVGYDALLSGSYASSLAFVSPIGKDAAFGAGFSFFTAGAIQGYTAVGDPGEKFAPYDFAVSAAYARRLPKCTVGAAVKALRSDVAGASGGTAAVDLGLIDPDAFQLGEAPVDVGVSLRNLGPPISVGGASSPLPFKLQIGGLWKAARRVRILLDGHMPVDERPYVSFGGEGLLVGTEQLAMFLRAGYNMRHTRQIEGFSGVTTGFGFDLRRIRVDYAWVPFGDLGQTNRVSIAIAF